MIGFAQLAVPDVSDDRVRAGSEPDDERSWPRLSPWRRFLIQDLTQVEFSRRMEPMFEAWKLSGYWEKPHPWMETTLPWDRREEYIETVLSSLPPGALGAGGHVLLWPAKTSTSEVPLFMHPGGEQVLGWGILGPFHTSKLDEMLAQLDMASELSSPTAEALPLGLHHLRDTRALGSALRQKWPRLCAAKRSWDPNGILAPGSFSTNDPTPRKPSMTRSRC